jgi:putative transposase
VRTLAQALGLSRQRVYFILKNEVKTKRRKKEMEDDKVVLEKIEAIARELPIYGYRRVAAVLRMKFGMDVNRKRVYRIMKERGLLMPPSHSNKKLFRGVPFAHKVQAERSNELWGIDMTYIWCGGDAWCYMHAVIDHHDKNLLGYSFSRSCSALGGVMALAEAASKRPVDSLEIRSDNGCHYGARIFKDEIKRLGINHTRTMVNTPKGNAVVERFFRSLKEECVWQNRFKSFEEAKAEVDHWISTYNNDRPHQSLEYQTPKQYYERSKTIQKTA